MSQVNEKKTSQPLILLVDNMPLNIQILHHILNTGEYAFALASSGKETLKMVKENPPDLILLDILLGDIDGFEVCKMLKENPQTSDIPIIFLTARVSVEDKVKGFDLGAVDYITKPFENAEVLARVHTHVKLKKSTDLIKEYNRRLSETLGEIKQSYQVLKDSQDKLIKQKKEEAIQAMVITANHEIKQPLTLIKGYLDLLKESMRPESLSAAQNKYLESIEKAFDKIIDILEKFSESASIEFGDYLPRIKMVVFQDQNKDSNLEN